MKTWRVALWCSLAALCMLVSRGTVGAGQVPPNRRIITLKAGANPLTVARRHKITVGNIYSVALRGFAGRVPAGSMNALATDPDIVRVEQDALVHAIAQTIPTGVSRIGAPLNPYAQINGKDERVNIDIAIIDTGIALKHPELNVVFNKSFITGETSGQDRNGHGTHVAGTIGAIDNGTGVVGVAPGARLWALKVLDASGSGYMSDIIKAIDYVAANSDKIAVVNMSLGGQGRNDSMRQAIQNCVIRGVVFVVAAGNDAMDVYGPDGVFGTSDDCIPAAYPEVCCVSALCDTDGKAGGTGPRASYGYPDDTLASFSNYSRYVLANAPVKSPGAAIDLAAPGVDIYSTYLSGGYATGSGTSMASPHVAGAVALYIAEHGRATSAAGVYAIRQALVDAAQPQSQWGPANTGDRDLNHEGCVRVGGSAPPPPNTAPTVAITAPTNGAIFAYGTSIPFAGSATDTQDGTLTTNLKWTSNLDGPVGTGGSFTKALTAGTHTITASVTDTGSLTGSASITITVQSTANTAPTVTITAPTNGATFAYGTSIPFTGTATDTQDGTLTAKLAWASNLDGALGTGGSFTKSLTPGTHTVTASVTDTGSLTGSASITITVQSAANTAPTVTITAPTNGATFAYGTSIPFTGAATDTQDGTLAAKLAWASNLDGALGTGGSFTKSLTPGTHTVTASVTDTGGLTGSASVTVTVQPSGDTPPSVAIASGETRTGTLGVGGLDAYTFTGAAGTSVTILMGASSGSLDPAVELHAPDGAIVATAWGSSAATIEAQRLCLSGTYYIVCRDHLGTYTGQYAVSLIVNGGSPNSAQDPDGGAIASGETRTGTLGVGDLDACTFTGTAGTSVTILIGASSGSLDPHIELHAPDGTVVVTAWGSSAATIEAQRLFVTGTYYILCRDHWGTYTGQYAVSLIVNGGSPNSAQDPDGGAIASGETRTGTLGVGDLDACTFTGTAGTSVTILIGASSGSLDPHIELHAPDGTVVVTAWGSSAATIEAQRLFVTGTYYILCRDHWGTYTGQYAVSLIVNGGSPNSAQDPDGGAIASGETRTGTLGVGDLDACTFTGTAGTSVTILIGASSGSLDPHIELHAPDGTVVVTAWGSSAATIEAQRLFVTGTYYILCRDHWGTYTGQYAVSLIVNGGSPNSAQDPDGGAIASGETRTGTLGVGDLDACTFTGTAGTSVTIRMAATSGSLDPGVELHAPDGTVVATAWGSSVATIASQRLPLSGTYYILCRDHWGTYTGNYSVSLGVAAAGAAHAVADPPSLGVISEGGLSFGEVARGDAMQVQNAYAVRNVGGGTLRVTVSVDAPFFVLRADGLPVNALSFDLAAGTERAVALSFAPLTPGPAKGTIYFSSRNGGATTRVVAGSCPNN